MLDCSHELDGVCTKLVDQIFFLAHTDTVFTGTCIKPYSISDRKVSKNNAQVPSNATAR